MDIVEYKTIKKVAKTQLGADDAESLNYFAVKIEKQSKFLKWLSILLGVLSIPLLFVLIGFIMLPASILLYFFGYRRLLKKAKMFREFIKNDPELSAA
ncbi:MULTISPECIES: hypothetical protein [Vibrio]|uniref:hypothetical protein n=1 Tax=Vibrio TaxID=662 RepID=UPI00215C9284|nr:MULTISPECIES: hypothetical protein [Vibrio]MDF4384636.1 hypothetical protein [Vibrio parahaemolyticus]MCR9641876.1 hypothetical protein [Vibrio alginolyticus]MDW2055592.1 hypothetical protein [Vibrio sp. 506]MDW2096990.1 hypothetical protein [Vibrio sp. 1751]MDW2243822.1 hypothetical protein [Vibrio sp. 1287]